MGAAMGRHKQRFLPYLKGRSRDLAKPTICEARAVARVCEGQVIDDRTLIVSINRFSQESNASGR